MVALRSVECFLVCGRVRGHMLVLVRFCIVIEPPLGG